MKTSVLASGSKGNSCYIEINNHKILIDLGTTCLDIEKRLKDIDIDPHEINCVFITHTHIDHIAALKVFAKKYKPTIFLSQKMYNEITRELIYNDFVIIDKEITLDDIKVNIIKTSHDVDDSNGYIFEHNDKSLVYITDTGYINVKNHQLLKNKDIYIIESNHDVEMLMNNKNYPYPTKQRILGDYGHLSNQATADYLVKFIGERTQYIILTHLSENNNTPELALKTISETLEKKSSYKNPIIVASQRERTILIKI